MTLMSHREDVKLFDLHIFERVVAERIRDSPYRMTRTRINQRQRSTADTDTGCVSNTAGDGAESCSCALQSVIEGASHLLCFLYDNSDCVGSWKPSGIRSGWKAHIAHFHAC